MLVEANALLLTDIPGANGFLERQFRQPYSFDARNSSHQLTCGTTADQTSINVNAQLRAGSRHRSRRRRRAPTPFTPPPSTVPDSAASSWASSTTSPSCPTSRCARASPTTALGYFTTTRFDYSNDTALTPRVNYVNRWRLEKKDPAAALSEPKQPIVFWIDRNVPERYRPHGASPASSSGTRRSSASASRTPCRRRSSPTTPTGTRSTRGTRRFAGCCPRGRSSAASARAQSTRAPARSSMPTSASTRCACATASSSASSRSPTPAPPAFLADRARRRTSASTPRTRAEETASRSTCSRRAALIEPDSPEAEEFVARRPQGHRDARGRPRAGPHAQLPRLDRLHAGAAQRPRVHAGQRHRRLGDGVQPGEHRAARREAGRVRDDARSAPTTTGRSSTPTRSIAPERGGGRARGASPRAAASRSSPSRPDDEASVGRSTPTSTQLDLGTDPLEFAAQRFELARELWDRWQTRPLKPGESYARLRRNLDARPRPGARARALHRRQVRRRRLRRCATTPARGRAPLAPVPTAKQRDGARAARDRLFSADSFRFKPEFLRRLRGRLPRPRATRFDAGRTLPRNSTTRCRRRCSRCSASVLDRADGRRGRAAAARQRGEARPTRRRRSGCPSSTRRCTARSGASSRPARDIPLLRRNLQREHAARSPRRWCGRPARCPRTRARCCARGAAALRAELAAAQAKGGPVGGGRAPTSRRC